MERSIHHDKIERVIFYFQKLRLIKSLCFMSFTRFFVISILLRFTEHFVYVVIACLLIS